MDFYNWLLSEKGLSKATASKYNLVIQNRISEWLPSYERPINSIEYEALKLTIFDLDIYKERNKIGNNMYSSALNHYGHYLKELDIHDQTIFNELESFTSEAERKIKVRLVQNKFRKVLFDLHPCCAVSGLQNAQFLIASHIKPWSVSNDQERLDHFNGLLLTPNFDRLFDRGFISFKLNGEIVISKSLDQNERFFFQIPKKLVVDLKKEHKVYLEYHMDEIFKN